MQKYWIAGFIGLLVLVILACGSDATSTPQAASQPAATTAVAQQQPAATTASAASSAPVASSLADLAAKLAGGPGAIYVGDLNQLVGPAASEKQGDFDGNVPLDALYAARYP